MRPRWRFAQSIVTPSEAGSPGKGGTRERAQFSPPGGNGDKRTQGELARRAKRRWPGPLRRRAAMGKVGRRRGGEISPHTTDLIQNPPPHPSRLRRATFPPGGRLKKEQAVKSPAQSINNRRAGPPRLWPRPASLAPTGQFTFSRPTDRKQWNRAAGASPRPTGLSPNYRFIPLGGGLTKSRRRNSPRPLTP